MFTYKKTPYKNFALDLKFCWADPGNHKGAHKPNNQALGHIVKENSVERTPQNLVNSTP